MGRRRKKRSKKKFYLLLIFFVVIGALILKNMDDSPEYLQSNNDESIVFNDENSGYKFLKEENTYFLSFDFIKKYIDDTIFFDKGESILTISNRSQVIRMKYNIGELWVNESKVFDNNDFIIDKGIPYVSVAFLNENYGISYNYSSESKKLVIMDDSLIGKGRVLRKTRIYSQADTKSPIVADINEVDIKFELTLFGEEDKFFKVTDIYGYSGYIPEKDMEIIYLKNKNIPAEESTVISNDNKIILTWDEFAQTGNNSLRIKELPGVNVISPIVYSIVDSEGSIKGNLEQDYISKYHEMGVKVWPLISNSFNPEMTDKFLSKSETREKIINNMISDLEKFGFEGYVIDFENMNIGIKDYFSQFLRELYPLLHNKGKYLSVCVTGVSTSENWSLCYDREKIGRASDYLILMAYDQHYQASPVAGSVAELPWVDYHINELFKYVSADRIILGIPFYSRLWVSENGKLSSTALIMEGVDRFLEEHKLNKVWLDEIKQNYVEHNIDNKNYKLWIEDTVSLGYRYELVYKYNLSGIASWRKGYEKPEIWEQIRDTFEME